MKKILIIILLLPLYLIGISLDEAISASLENNHSLNQEKQEVEVYDQKYYAARGMLLPQLSLQGQYALSRTKVPKNSLADIELLSSMLNDEYTDLSSNENILWENEQLISAYLDQTVDGLMPEDVIEEGSFAAGISLNQTLFAGGKLLSGIKIADRVRNMQRDKFKLKSQEVIYQTISLYYAVKLSESVLDIQQEALDLTKEHLSDVNKMFEQGLVSEYDKLRAELEYKRLEPEVLQAKYNLNLARENFCNYTGIGRHKVKVLETEFTLPGTDGMDLSAAIDEGMEQRIELQLSELNVRIQEVLVKMEKADFYPVVGFTASYNLYTAADSYDIETADFGNSASVGIGFQLPLFTGLTRLSELREQQAKVYQSKEIYAETKEMVLLDIRNAWQKLDHSMRQYSVQEKNSELALRAYEIAQARYASGQGTELEITDAQLMLEQARLTCSQAVYNVILSKAYYDKALGRDLNLSRKEK